MRRRCWAISHEAYAAVVLLFLVGCARAPVIVGHRSIRIDARTLRVEMLGPIPAQVTNDRVLPVVGSYYTHFVNQHGDIAYDHYGPVSADGRIVRYSHFESGSDRVIHKLTKQQVLLSGAFGTVYTEKTCYFGLSPSYLNHLWVTTYANSAESELPILDDKEPLPWGTLTHISLVRVFQRQPGYVIVSAVYTPSGRIQHLWINASKAGDWIHPSQFSLWPDGFLVFNGDAKQRSTLTRFGFPAAFDTQSYLALTIPPFRSTVPDVQLSVVNLHFDYNRWVRQDSFSTTGSHTTRYLSFARTDEDSVLQNGCAAGFATKQEPSGTGSTIAPLKQ